LKKEKALGPVLLDSLKKVKDGAEALYLPQVKVVKAMDTRYNRLIEREGRKRRYLFISSFLEKKCKAVRWCLTRNTETTCQKKRNSTRLAVMEAEKLAEEEERRLRRAEEEEARRAENQRLKTLRARPPPPVKKTRMLPSRSCRDEPGDNNNSNNNNVEQTDSSNRPDDEETNNMQGVEGHETYAMQAAAGAAGALLGGEGEGYMMLHEDGQYAYEPRDANDNRWECPRCTLLNLATATLCDGCEWEKSG